MQRVLLILLLCVVTVHGLDSPLKVHLTHSNALPSFHVYHATNMMRFSEVTDFSYHSLMSPHQLGLMFSHLLGLRPTEQLEWNGLRSTNALFRPRCIALITLDGLPIDSTVSLPAGTISYRTDRIAGAGEWIREGFNTDIIMTRINEVLGDERNPLAVSASSNEGVAKSGPTGSRRLLGYITDGDNRVMSVKDYFYTEIPQQRIIQLLTETQLGSTVSIRDSTVLIDSEVVFNMDYPEDERFLSEISLIRQILDGLKEETPLTLDHTPDLISLAFTALKGIRIKHGDDSPQVSIAMKLYSTLLPQLIAELSSIYSGDIAVFGLTLSWVNPTDSAVHSTVVGMHSILKQHLTEPDIQQYMINLPDIDLSDETIENHYILSELCRQATNLAYREEILEVTCHNVHRRDVTYYLASADINKTNFTITNYADEFNSDFPYLFNIIILVLLIMFLSLFAISYIMWFMDPGWDSIIYRLTLPSKLKTD